MPFPTTPLSGATHYDPVPGAAEHPGDEAYDHPPTPPSPSHQPAHFQDPYDPLDDIPAARPRFMGAAAHSGEPRVRDSIASSQFLSQSGRSENSSVYALNANSSAYALGDGAPQHPDPSRSSSYDAAYRDDPSAPAGFAAAADVPMRSYGAASGYMEEKRVVYQSPHPTSRRRLFIITGIVAGVILIIAVVVAVSLTVAKKHDSKSSTSGATGDSPASPTSTSVSSPNHSTKLAVTGGDGSKVTMDDGTTFTYSNSYGGTWYYDDEDPYNNAAKVNSWTPGLNETFNYGTNKIFGVNLGGWLNTEPVSSSIDTPALYEPYVNGAVPAVDEWTLSWAMANDTAKGGLKQMETHYDTFITERDFAEIAGAGLNFVRIPVPYWMIEVRQGEPFLEGTAFKYLLKAIKWARKYGIRINIDLHTLPGSQNGWNHSGRLGDINMLNGPMGLANAQRSLDYIRIIAEFMSQPQYRDVLVMFGITNEPFGPTMGQENLSRYYVEAYNIVRTASGSGVGPTVSFHDGFLGLPKWAGFVPGADNVALDYHPYMCFGTQPTTPIADNVNGACSAWGAQMNTSMDAFGMTAAGEFSLAVTDCGKYLNGVGLGTRYEGDYTDGTWTKVGSCTPWTDWQNWDDAYKASMLQIALSSMDALQNWFFWNWKIGNSSVSGAVETPAWSYQLGLENGWIPKDPRAAAGACGNTDPWTGTLSRGSGAIPASATNTLAWPPTSISHAGAATLLPSYTPTGAVPTLSAPAPTGAASTVSAGSGWNNAADTASMMVPVATCTYLDPWVGPKADPPSPLCGGSTKRRDMQRVRAPVITPPPTL